MLNVDWTLAEPSAGDSRAWSRMRVWMLGIAANPVAPISNTVIGASTGWCAVTTNRARLAARAVRNTHSVRSGARSARRPPTAVPTVIPTPNNANNTVTVVGEYPVTSVSTGLM